MSILENFALLAVYIGFLGVLCALRWASFGYVKKSGWLGGFGAGCGILVLLKNVQTQSQTDSKQSPLFRLGGLGLLFWQGTNKQN